MTLIAFGAEDVDATVLDLDADAAMIKLVFKNKLLFVGRGRTDAAVLYVAVSAVAVE
jgi:hypothetical protein